MPPWSNRCPCLATCRPRSAAVSDDAEYLLWLCYSPINVSFPVEVWRQARVPDSGATSLDGVVEQVVSALSGTATARSRTVRDVEVVDHIDLYQLHRPDRSTPLDETMRAPDDLVTRDLVRAIGGSNFRAWEVAGAVAGQRTLGRPAFGADELTQLDQATSTALMYSAFVDRRWAYQEPVR